VKGIKNQRGKCSLRVTNPEGLIDLIGVSGLVTLEVTATLLLKPFSFCFLQKPGRNLTLSLVKDNQREST